MIGMEKVRTTIRSMKRQQPELGHKINDHDQ